MIAAHLVITGRVQGVGYRAWLTRRAEALGLAGWVRNRADGSVEAVVEGDAAAIETLVAECRRGPRLAEVSGVARRAAEATGASGFRQLPTL